MPIATQKTTALTATNILANNWVAIAIYCLLNLCINSPLKAQGKPAVKTEKLSTYFETVDPNLTEPKYYMKATMIYRNRPARIFGLQVSDKIVGIENKRIHSLAEYSVLRYENMESSAIKLQVIRNKKLITIDFPYSEPTRRLGFDSVDIKVDLAKHFKTQKISLGKFTTGNTSLTLLPARAKTALLRLSNNPENSKKNKTWIEAFSILYFNAVNENFAEAKSLCEKSPLKDTAPDAFLGSLVKFYAALSQHSLSTSLSPEATHPFHVNTHFLALCYPYPHEAIDQGVKIDLVDKDFLKDLGDKFSSDRQVRFNSKNNAQAYANKKTSTNALKFVTQVKASILNSSAHGGWPYRSSQIYKKDKRLKVISALEEMLDEKSADSIIIHYSLLSLYAIENKQRKFEKHYKIVFDQSHALIASADVMLGHLQSVWRKSTWLNTITGKIKRDNNNKPWIYHYLGIISSEFKRIAKHHQYIISDGHISGINGYCTKNAHKINRFLRYPLDRKKNLVDIKAGLGSTDATAIKKGFTAAKREFYYRPTKALFKNFINLGKQHGVSELMDALAVGTILNGSRFRYKTSLVFRYFLKIDNEQYHNVYQALTKVPNEKLDEVIAKLEVSAGTPAAFMLFADAYKRAGLDEKSEVFFRRTKHFHDAIINTLGTKGRYNNFRWMAMRTYASHPIGTKHFNALLRRELKRNLDTTYAMAAMVAYYEKDPENVLKYLKKAIDDDAKRDTDALPFDGKPKRVKDLTKIIAAKALSLKGLSDIDKTAFQMLAKGQSLELISNAVALPSADDLLQSEDDKAHHTRWHIAKNGKLYREDTTSGVTSELKEPFDDMDYDDQVISAIGVGPSRLWLGTNHGLFALGLASSNINEYAIENETIDEPVTKLSVKDSKLTITYGKNINAAYDIKTSRWLETP